MARSIIDPITRIEGHLRAEMEVENGVVTNAWMSGGCFRGMELVVQDRTPEDAAHIVQRICGVCPVSHAHASSIAAEKAYGITIPNNCITIDAVIYGLIDIAKIDNLENAPPDIISINDEIPCPEKASAN